eukprot:NODE_762_length_4433_cov_0.172127.p3 type:complete len:204 gc:universal NODE_762_length_4433_cov_0.172127:247-858(+)
MRPFEPFLLQQLPFRYRSSIWMDKYLEYIAFQKMDSKYYVFVYTIMIYFLNGTIGQRFMQLKQNIRQCDSLNRFSRLSILAIVACRYIQFKCPIIDDLMWLLYIQDLISKFSLEHIFSDFEFVESDKISEILGYISSAIHIGQYLEKIKSIPKFVEHIKPPYKAYKSFQCSNCSSPIVSTAKVDNFGTVFCGDCGSGRKVILH